MSDRERLALLVGIDTEGDNQWDVRSRTHQTFHNLPIDRSIEITEGRDGFRVLDAAPIPLP